MKTKRVIESLDQGWNDDHSEAHQRHILSETLTEADGLEAWHQRQAEYENESQAMFAMARARLRSAFEAGILKKELSMQQYDILRLMFNEGKTTREVADTLHTSIENVDHQFVKLIKKLHKFFK